MSKRSRSEGFPSSKPSLVSLSSQSEVGSLNATALEEIRLTESGCKLYLGASDQGAGYLFVTTERVAWMDASNTYGYEIPYVALILHAICRDPEAYPEPCMLCQLDGGSTDMDEDEDNETKEGDAEATTTAASSSAEASSNNASSAASSSGLSSAAARASSGRVDLSSIRELRLIPSSGTSLDGMFAALCACAELHPDAVGEGDEMDEGGGGFFYGGEEGGGGGGVAGLGDGEAGGEGAAAMLAHWDSLLTSPPSEEGGAVPDQFKGDDEE